MSLNDSIRYVDDKLYCDSIPVAALAQEAGTPVYIYSLRRVLHNYKALTSAFSGLDAHIHYSAKANANPAILRILVEAGAGIDAVSAGEIFLALNAGVAPEQIVFAGVGKTTDEIRYAVERGVGWINVENLAECDVINTLAGEFGRVQQVALRLNPEVTASTHPYIATGHGGAKFGLTADAIRILLDRQADFPNLAFVGLHVHIGSQLKDVSATVAGVKRVLKLIEPYPGISVINIGGGFPAAYDQSTQLPGPAEFAESLRPLLRRYQVLVEPGRSIVADAGILVTKLLYVKQHAGQTFYIVDASMTELIRPALYGAVHQIVPVTRTSNASTQNVQVVGPVCETADVLGRDMVLPELAEGDLLAILTAGAYGAVMSSNYNARPRPAEIAVDVTGTSWQTVRRRETFADLIARNMLLEA